MLKLHDNDSAFHKEFQKACKELGISQYWSRPRTPTDNPVNENFNGALKREFLGLDKKKEICYIY